MPLFSQVTQKLSGVRLSCASLLLVDVYSLTFTHYQRTYLGYSFNADFCYQLIRE